MNNTSRTASKFCSARQAVAWHGQARSGVLWQGRIWRRAKTLRLCFFICSSIALVGCAHFSSRQTETSLDGTQRTTRISVSTFFDAHNDLAKLRASTTDRTQNLNLPGLNANASSTNAVKIVDIIEVV